MKKPTEAAEATKYLYESLFASIRREREEERAKLRCGYYFSEAYVEEWAAKCEAKYPQLQEISRESIAEDNTTPCYFYEKIIKEYFEEQEGVKLEPLRNGDVHKQTPPPKCPKLRMCSYYILRYSESIKKSRADRLDAATKHLTETTQAVSLLDTSTS